MGRPLPAWESPIPDRFGPFTPRVVSAHDESGSERLAWRRALLVRQRRLPSVQIPCFGDAPSGNRGRVSPNLSRAAARVARAAPDSRESRAYGGAGSSRPRPGGPGGERTSPRSHRRSSFRAGANDQGHFRALGCRGSLVLPEISPEALFGGGGGHRAHSFAPRGH